MSRFFIDRPVFACVIAILIVLGGLISFFRLPIAQYPNLTPPTVQISATYPGADAQTVADSVAAPIEEKLSGIKGLLYYSSTAGNDGSLSITATFDVGTDQDIAAVEVQNRLQQATSQLPAEVIKQGISVNKQSSDLLAIVSLQSSSPTNDVLFMTNYAQIHMIDELLRVQGVGEVDVFGGQTYAMRIWLDPDKLAAMGMTIDEVTNAIQNQNASFGAGSIGQRPVKGQVELTVPILGPQRLQEPEQYGNIILRADPDGSIVKLKDVAKIELGSQTYSISTSVNGKPTVLVGIFLQNEANALNTIAGVEKVLKKQAKAFPTGMTWSIPYDTTIFINDSISEVLKTIFEAFLIVIAVVFLFLQSWRATIIPIVVVPVSLIGTFLGLEFLGFSINTLTLFAMVLAVGIVVDDAIVVVENVERVMEEDHLPRREATIKAMTQVTGPVITVVLVLIAVFVPVTFLGGLVGQLYKQFAATIAISVTISGFMALTLSPALCAIVLKPKSKEPWFWFRWFNSGFEGVTNAYKGTVSWGLRHALVTMLIFGVLCFVTYRLKTILPSGFLPVDDQGYVLTVAQLPQGASMERTEELSNQVIKYLKSQPQVENVVAVEGMNLFNGFSGATNAATFWTTLKPFEERKSKRLSAQALTYFANKHFMANPAGLVFTVMPPSIQGLGIRSGFDVQLEARGNSSVADLYEVKQKFLAEAEKNKDLTALRGTMEFTVPQLAVSTDRAKASMMGVALPNIYNAMNAYLGGLYVNNFNRFGRVWRVIVQAKANERMTPSDIGDIYVRNSDNQRVPLSAMVNLEWQAGPDLVQRYNGFPSVEITGTPAPGISSGQAMDSIAKLAASKLPSGYTTEWTGQSYQEQQAGAQAAILLLFSLVVVFLVIAAQYEMWFMPIGILLAVPFAILGALVAIQFRGLSQDIYFEIGLLVLVGLAAKNAVLIVQFCLILRSEGISIRESAIQGARIRFRPIVMTSLAFIFGVFPLAIASGALSAARHSIGTGIIGGMVAGTFLATIFVPVFFEILQYLSEKAMGRTLQEKTQKIATRYHEKVSEDI